MSGLDHEFFPSVFHPFYFIRNGLKKAITSYSSSMNGKMMDFGCGSKPYRSLFKVDEYIGVDFQNAGHSHQKEQIEVFYDGKKIPLPDNYFDSVLCSEVFEHIFNLEEILGEINRVMKKGGHLLVTCPFTWNEHEAPYDYARYTQFALKDILNRGGFETIEYRKSGNFITTVVQLWLLYWYTLLDKRAKKNFLVRFFYKIFIILPSNIAGKIFNWLLPANDSLYLNNVILAKKSS